MEVSDSRTPLRNARSVIVLSEDDYEGMIAGARDEHAG
jgi:hypothetical protein